MLDNKKKTKEENMNPADQKNVSKEHAKNQNDEKIDSARIAELEKKANERDEYYDKYVRLSAEFDNARKRMEKDRIDFIKFANEAIIKELFPILDSFDSAIQNMEKVEKDKAILEGLKLLQGKFHKVLESNGLSVMSAAGEKFDPLKHEAVLRVHSDKHPEGTITEEVRNGYFLNGRMLRPAMVKVAFKEDVQQGKKETPH